MDGEHIRKGRDGVLTVSLQKKLVDGSISEIEELANQKISEGVEIKVEELERSEAERRYGDEKYDLFRVLGSIKLLKVASIADWNVNACNKLRTATTREIGHVTLGKWRYRNSKNVLEISFDVS